MTTELATQETTQLAEREAAGVRALGHVLGTGDLAQLSNELQPCLQRPSQEVDDLSVQTPGLPLRAFFDGCVKIGWQTDEQANQLSHDVPPGVSYCYNSSTLVAGWGDVDEVVVGEIRCCRDVGMKGGGRKVIGHACADCGKKRWMLMDRGRRPLPTRCAPCQGRIAIRAAQAKNVGTHLSEDRLKRIRGSNAGAWKGGRHRRPGGYMAVWVAPDDPLRVMAYAGRSFVLEHRLVMARALGRPLESWERVHHRNGVRDDNRIENLELWKLGQPPGIRQADYHCPGCRCGEGT